MRYSLTHRGREFVAEYNFYPRTSYEGGPGYAPAEVEPVALYSVNEAQEVRVPNPMEKELLDEIFLAPEHVDAMTEAGEVYEYERSNVERCGEREDYPHIYGER